MTDKKIYKVISITLHCLKLLGLSSCVCIQNDRHELIVGGCYNKDEDDQIVKTMNYFANHQRKDL